MTDGAAAAGRADALEEIDRIMQDRLDAVQRSLDLNAQLDADRNAFSDAFTRVCADELRPTMEAIVERIRQNGGGGLVDERLEDASRHQCHRLTLWMSLAGEIEGTPRLDRHPYLQLDADVDRRSVTVSEGDMWQGRGGTKNGRVGGWKLVDVTGAQVMAEALAVLRRAAA